MSVASRASNDVQLDQPRVANKESSMLPDRFMGVFKDALAVTFLVRMMIGAVVGTACIWSILQMALSGLEHSVDGLRADTQQNFQFLRDDVSGIRTDFGVNMESMRRDISGIHSSMSGMSLNITSMKDSMSGIKTHLNEVSAEIEDARLEALEERLRMDFRGFRTPSDAITIKEMQKMIEDLRPVNETK